MTPSKKAETAAEEAKKAARAAKKEAIAERKAKAKVEASKTKDALAPTRNRVLALVQEYESDAPFEHARRMDKLLHDALRAIEIGCQEAEKDLAKISAGEAPCRPSVLRQRLNDLL
ncbi:MAG TPA: hypothetical protein EYG11_07080 [Candidatus Latescibacteria bacterium]|nr:hypothetical protein [Candidatus Handelsmanbacteria bacterium]HIL08449.1 hypothetical protein [Candidatus Latescibacterota bacterium]